MPRSGPESLHELFEQVAEALGDRMAISVSGSQISYRELNARSNQLAHHLLQTHQLRKNDVIGLMVDRSGANDHWPAWDIKGRCVFSLY